MATRTPTEKPKPIQSRHRLRWASRYPLRPGRDIMSRRGLLVLIAEVAVSGQFWGAIKTREATRPGDEDHLGLAEQAGLHESSVRALLKKLCAEGALRGQARGFRRTTRYHLQRLDEVVEHGDFLPAEEPERPTVEAQQRFPRTGARTVERNGGSGRNGVERLSTSAYIGAGLEPDQPSKNGVERLSTRAREDLSACLPAPKKREREEEKGSTRIPIGILDAPANGAPRLASASSQNLSSLSSTEDNPVNGKEYRSVPSGDEIPYKQQLVEAEDIQPTGPKKVWAAYDPEAEDEDTGFDDEEEPHPISPTARRLDACLRSLTGRPLDIDWLGFPGLEREISAKGFGEVSAVLASLQRQNGGHILPPTEFFAEWKGYWETHRAREARGRNGRRRAA